MSPARRELDRGRPRQPVELALARADRLGRKAAGAHCVAITAPGSGLADAAAQFPFRHRFLGDPTSGGRYSAPSLFGLVPGALTIHVTGDPTQALGNLAGGS